MSRNLLQLAAPNDVMPPIKSDFTNLNNSGPLLSNSLPGDASNDPVVSFRTQVCVGVFLQTALQGFAHVPVVDLGILVLIAKLENGIRPWPTVGEARLQILPVPARVAVGSHILDLHPPHNLVQAGLAAPLRQANS